MNFFLFTEKINQKRTTKFVQNGSFKRNHFCSKEEFTIHYHGVKTDGVNPQFE